MPLRVKLRPSKFLMGAGCVLCGEEFQLSGVRATLWDEKERIGNVCYECFKKGAKEFPLILREHIKRLRREADDPEKLSKHSF